MGDATLRSPRQQRTLVRADHAWSVGGPAELDLRSTVYHQVVEREIRAHSENLETDFVRADVDFATTGGHAHLVGVLDHHLVSAGVQARTTEADPRRTVEVPFLDVSVPSPPFRDGRQHAIGIYVQDELASSAGP